MWVLRFYNPDWSAPKLGAGSVIFHTVIHDQTLLTAKLLGTSSTEMGIKMVVLKFP